MIERINTRVTGLFGIRYPIVQGGMAWVSGWKLAAAVSNAGGLGLIGGASMQPDVLREHINKLRSVCDKPFGVNIVLAGGHDQSAIDVCVDCKVKIIFTAAGSPKKFTSMLHGEGVKVVHVVPSLRMARKAEEAGCDAVVAEGFESGGHGGFDEITSMCLWPAVADAVRIPVIAAGGIIDGRGMAAAMSQGVDGVQVGSRFAITEESSASREYKDAVLNAKEEDAKLYFRQYIPTRSLANDYVLRAIAAERRGAEISELQELRGKFRAKNGIFEGNLVEGDLEIGQAAGRINNIPRAEEVVRHMIEDYCRVINTLHESVK